MNDTVAVMNASVRSAEAEAGRGARVLSPVLLVLTIAGLAVVVRLAAVFALGAHLPERAGPTAMEHRAIANFLMLDAGFAFHDWGVTQTTSVQSPPYPAVLYAAFAVFGAETQGAYLAALSLNALAGGLAAAATFFLCRRFGGDKATAAVAAALVAVWPTQVYLATAVQAIALITACVAAMTWLFYKALDTGRVGPWLGFGVTGCLGALAEPVLLPPVFFTGLLIFVWKSRLTLGQRFRNACVLLVCGLSILGPWTARNYVVHETFMPVKSTFWVNFWKGNNPHATGTDRLPLDEARAEQLAAADPLERDRLAKQPEFDHGRQYDRLTDAQVAELTGKDEVEREQVFRKYATTFVGENPNRYLELCLTRLGKTLWIDWDNPKTHQPLYIAQRALLLALAAVGLVISLRRGWRLGMPALIVGCGLLMYTTTITAERFTLPYEPFALCLAALAICAPWSGRRRRHESPLAEAAA